MQRFLIVNGFRKTVMSALIAIAMVFLITNKAEAAEQEQSDPFVGVKTKEAETATAQKVKLPKMEAKGKFTLVEIYGVGKIAVDPCR